ncbi:hypothetical protein BUALT_Bualt16G0006600 [Buddleja alternifolia]|uniref:NAC domain-containing protein n=1 Tax=Buddleja alternifolia TaxID=168488 RepID=A0AAV6WFP3_9LAMI|nr:hypothetical protein BUALT_Bualt16G0006600 [Buddleja alternifolia]
MEKLSNFNTTDEPIELPPGFRFHPSDEELITYYLSPKVLDSSFTTIAIGEVDLNRVEPWDLPWKAKMGEKEWYFFCVRDRKYPTGFRTNRATNSGYWKATGKDKEIFRGENLVGMKKTLVFYRGRAPRGEKSNWVMHEYRLEDKHSMHNLSKSAKNECVICRIFKKTSGGKKVHISGLMKNRNSASNSLSYDLPSLKDFSSDENRTRSTYAVVSHVPCFSNPMEDSQHNFVNELNSSSLKNNGFSSQSFQLLLENDGTKKEELSGDCGINTYLSSAISNQDMEFKPYDDQEFPNLDCLWDY